MYAKLDAMFFKTLSGFYQENPANCPRPTRPLTVLVQFAVIVAILCDLLIRVAHTLEYPARVSKNAWVEAVVEKKANIVTVTQWSVDAWQLPGFI